MIEKSVDYFNIHDLKPDLKKHAIRGGGITVLARLTIFLIQTMSLVILARILGPEEFGLLAMVTSLGGFLVIFTDLGLTDAIIQTTDINHNQISTLFWVNVAVGIVIVLIVSALSPLVAMLYSEPRLIKITMLWSTYLFFASLSTQHIALLKRRMLFFETTKIEIAAAFISNLLGIILALCGFGYWALVFREIALGICVTAGAWLLCRWRPGAPSFISGIQSMLNFGRNATGSFILGYFARNLDKILIGWKYGAIQLGYYNRAYYLFVLPTTQLTEAIKNVATSTLSKIRDNPAKYHSYYLRAISLLSFIGMPLSFYFMLESEDLILLFLGPKWKDTIEIFQILAAGAGVWIIYSTNYWLHASLGRSDRMIKWGMFQLIFIAAAMLVSLSMGPKAVASAYTILLYLLTGIGLKYAGAPINLKFRSIVHASWKYFIAAIIAALLCWYLIHLWDIAMLRITKITFSFLLYTAIYLIFIVILHGNIRPIMESYAIIREMRPK